MPSPGLNPFIAWHTGSIVLIEQVSDMHSMHLANDQLFTLRALWAGGITITAEFYRSPDFHDVHSLLSWLYEM